MHTLGPWFTETLSTIGHCAIVDADGFTIANPSPMGQDNARLIAAAPDLLDALRRVMRHVPADAGGASIGDDMYRARLAIARATGGQ